MSIQNILILVFNSAVLKKYLGWGGMGMTTPILARKRSTLAL